MTNNCNLPTFPSRQALGQVEHLQAAGWSWDRSSEGYRSSVGTKKASDPTEEVKVGAQGGSESRSLGVREEPQN